MKLVFLFVLSLLSQLAYGQKPKATSIPTYNSYKAEADTSLYFKADRAVARKIQLQNLQGADDAFHFRLWSHEQALDIWTRDGKLYFGAVTSYAQHYDAKLFQKGTRQVDTIFFRRAYLPTTEAKQIFQLIDSLTITGIPGDNQIAGWGDGFDGTEYRIETSSPASYTYKTYWTPRVFAATLWEARQIQTLVDKLYGKFRLASYAKQLNLLPGHYQHDGVEGVPIITLTPAEDKQHEVSLFDWF
jgi:hypothetical protein